MSDTSDHWQAYDAARSAERQENRIEAGADFQEASANAEANGLKLVQHSEQHYSLRSVKHGWIMNIYPGNQRLYSDRQRRAPFLKVPITWTLMTVVAAAIQAET